jgi:hypothetical protein
VDGGDQRFEILGFGELWLYSVFPILPKISEYADIRLSVALGQPATLTPGFPNRAELRARYAERSGRDLSQLDFFVALGYWKLAIILEGVYARYAAGQYGNVDPGIEEFARLVERLAKAAEEAERRG